MSSTATYRFDRNTTSFFDYHHHLYDNYYSLHLAFEHGIKAIPLVTVPDNERG